VIDELLEVLVFGEDVFQCFVHYIVCGNAGECSVLIDERFGRGSSSENGAVTVLAGYDLKQWHECLPLVRVEMVDDLLHGQIWCRKEQLCCAVISAHGDDLADLAPLGIPAYLGDNLDGLRISAEMSSRFVCWCERVANSPNCAVLSPQSWLMVAIRTSVSGIE